VGGYEAIGTIDPVTSVIFLGSGFSLESTNLKGEHPPNGAGLRKHFISALGLPADTTYDLQILTDEFAEKDADRLSRELYSIFRISSAGPNQSLIFSQNWFRIYTTNYDDTVEICHHARGVPPRSFDIQNDVPNKLPKNSVIHLHGSIRAVTPENALSSLVLGEGSYVRQYLAKSPWYNQFQIDMRFASQIFIVGYSMADYHISALLLENPELAKKTFFIQGPRADATFIRRTKSYGQALFIGLEGLVEAITKLPRPEPLSDITRLSSFRALDPQRDKKGLKPPTANEIFDLVVFGAFNYARCVATLPNETYVISRQKEVDRLLSELPNNRSIIVDSRLGNGKTIFLYLAFIALAERRHNCFLFKDVGPEMDAEVALLKKIPRLVILFDQYTISQDVLNRLANDLPDAKFIVEIRTSIFEVRYHEISESIPKPFSRVSLNYLSKSDVSAFNALCDRAGLVAARGSASSTSGEMRDILLELFDSDNIKSKVAATLAPIFESLPRRKVLLVTTLLSSFNLSIDPSFIKTVTGVDPYHEFVSIREISDEIFEIGLDVFKIRSSVFSEYAVLNFLPAREILDCIVEAAFAAAARKSERRYRVLMSNLMQYSNLHHMLRRQPDVTQLIVGAYERLRYDERINDEPLFWLQYAIGMAENGKLAAAQEFIEAAYDRATKRDGFQTYQIDTQAFRIALQFETEASPGSAVSTFPILLEKLELINSMLNEESHRGFAIKVLESIHPFIVRRVADLSVPEKTSLTFWMNTLIDTLGQLSAEYRARSGSDQTRTILENAKRVLLN
jgi:hypothetical protein